MRNLEANRWAQAFRDHQTFASVEVVATIDLLNGSHDFLTNGLTRLAILSDSISCMSKSHLLILTASKANEVVPEASDKREMDSYQENVLS